MTSKQLLWIGYGISFLFGAILITLTTITDWRLWVLILIFSIAPPIETARRRKIQEESTGN